MNANFAKDHGWRPRQVRQLIQALHIPAQPSERSREDLERLEAALAKGPDWFSHAHDPVDDRPAPHPEIQELAQLLGIPTMPGDRTEAEQERLNQALRLSPDVRECFRFVAIARQEQIKDPDIWADLLLVFAEVFGTLPQEKKRFWAALMFSDRQALKEAASQASR
ncbi:hypothetical protein L3556_06110 [Candidatus Synechococcus calcipolaris G9]|uniref:Uncharacterized protein n=1 Tax=Candidatus Synechococcus calcipolaris G9 TaxID=1497997 RepID=A0ABT6EXI3_9SYNE|nr:hypothetical protein [Candidatus Synechococcus calcipolaris]MDG2990509.1 hypothetical protein [Candidatus Synechococcus calcipolaris G9]